MHVYTFISLYLQNLFRFVVLSFLSISHQYHLIFHNALHRIISLPTSMFVAMLVLAVIASILAIAEAGSGDINEQQAQAQLQEVRAKLVAAQLKINTEEEAYCYRKDSKTREDLHRARYVNSNFGLDGESTRNTLVYPFCLHTKELGNRLGNYFTEVACASATGMHFLAVHKTFDLHGSHNHVNINANTNVSAAAALAAASAAADAAGGKIEDILSNLASSNSKKRRERHMSGGGAGGAGAGGVSLQQQQHRAFLDALPDVIPSTLAMTQTSEHAKEGLAKYCKCGAYCWSDPHAAWVNNTLPIKSIMHTAIHAYMDAIPTVIAMGTTISPDTDMTNAPAGEFLPILPDVAVQVCASPSSL